MIPPPTPTKTGTSEIPITACEIAGCGVNGFDAHSKNADAAAFADAVRQPDAVIPQCAVIDRNVSFCHGRLLSLSRMDNRILSIILRQSSGFNIDLQNEA